MDNQDHYSSDEGEVFFGSQAQSEALRRRRFLGSNYSSPVTPRPPRCNYQSDGKASVMPDVLAASNTSTPVARQPSTHTPYTNSSLNDSDDVIVIDNNSVSIIELSDDDSFVRNEEVCAYTADGENKDSGTSVNISNHTSCLSNKDITAELSDLHYGSFFSDKDFSAKSVVEDRSLHKSVLAEIENGTSTLSDLDENRSLHKSVLAEIENGTSTLSDLAEDRSFHKSVMAEIENGTIKRSDEGRVSDQGETNSMDYKTTGENSQIKYSIDNINSSLVQDINDFIGDSQILEMSTASENNVGEGKKNIDGTCIFQNLNMCSSEINSQKPDIEKVSNVLDSCSSTENSELQNKSKINEGTDINSVEHQGRHFLDVTGLSNLEYSLTGVTDSILNISHGSSLPSPDVKGPTNSPMCQQGAFYDNISFDDEKVNSVTGMSSVSEQIISGTVNEDLHMSVDVVDFQQDSSINFEASPSLKMSINTSQPSEYTSCLSTNSSYCTAHNDKMIVKNYSHSGQSDSFHNYRDVTDELNITHETDAISVKSGDENINEASFEIVIQNRQNSFNGTSGEKVPANNEASKPKVVSKLPVYQNPKSLLRPPKLYVKPNDLKTSSYKFAKNISKVESEKTPSKLRRPESLKSSGLKTVTSTVEKECKTPEKEKTFTKTPAKTNTSKQNFLLVKPKTPAQSPLLIKSKTPAQNSLLIKSKTPSQSCSNQTPVQNLSGIPRAVKSDSKVMRALTPLSSCNSSEKSTGKGSAAKNRYKHVVSPIHAYIRSSPPICQVKAQVIHEEKEFYSPDGKKLHLSEPKKYVLPKSSRKAVQKLEYKNLQGQENVNPNVINPCRDTIPCKILEPSLSVFWKEAEHTKSHLPKMGDKQTKLLAGTPKVTVTVHEGRVTESPNSKGILVKNTDNTIGSVPSEIQNIQEIDNCFEGSPARISIRSQKTAELP